MSKYFALIAGTPIYQAAKHRILPQSAFTALCTSQELLDRIHDDAEAYRKQVIAEAETVKEKATKDGFAEGYHAWAEQVSTLEAEIGRVHDELLKLVMPIALKAARKIVAAELTAAPETITAIVTQTLKSVAQHKRIIIYINKEDLATLERSKGQLKAMFEQLEALSIRERDDIERGGCIIETEAGIINAQLEDRWRTLDAAFEALYQQIKGAS